MLTLSPADIYRIFDLWRCGKTIPEIMRETHCAKMTVRSHLSLRYYHLYTEETRRRLAKLSIKPIQPKPIPAGYITLDDASFFFLTRPNGRTIRECYRDLPTEIVGTRKLTRPEWVVDYVRKNGPIENGIHIKKSAYAKLTGIQLPRHVTPLADLATLPPLPPSTVPNILRIMDFTGLPYYTIALSDLVT